MNYLDLPQQAVGRNKSSQGFVSGPKRVLSRTNDDDSKTQPASQIICRLEMWGDRLRAGANRCKLLCRNKLIRFSNGFSP
jgi:hypothetical protein